jgi:hypothetical protein
MWASTQQSEEQEDARANALIDNLDRQIEDLTEACEPIIAWDGRCAATSGHAFQSKLTPPLSLPGICGLVQVRDEEVAKEVRAPETKGGGNGAPPPAPS